MNQVERPLSTSEGAPAIEWRYRVALVIRFIGLTVAGFALIGGVLLACLNRPLGTGYATDLAVLSRLEERLPSVLLTFGITILIVVTASSFILTLIWTHAVSGPLVRIQRALHMLASGQQSGPLQFRKTDQLHHLAAATSRLLIARAERQKAWHAKMEQATRLIQDCQQWHAEHPDDTSGLRQRLAALAALYEQMGRLLPGAGSRNPR